MPCVSVAAVVIRGAEKIVAHEFIHGVVAMLLLELSE
jgi:hypothetical protein